MPTYINNGRGSRAGHGANLWRKSPCRQLQRACVDFLETRVLFTAVPAGTIAGATYTSDTEWTDTSQPYTLTGNVNVNVGATLTIGPGVKVVTSNGSQLSISGDNSGASISASGATFAVQVNANTTSGGSITASVFNTAPDFDSTSPSSVILSTDTFNSGVFVNPEFVPTLVGNTFASGSTVYVLSNRSITTNTTWPVIPNVSQYELVQNGGDGVYVQKGATLTVGNGITVTTDGQNYYTTEGLYVANDSSGAAFAAVNVKFATPLFLDSTASATVTGCQFLQGLFVGTPGGGGVSITGCTFSQTPTFDAPSNSALTLSGNTFKQGVQIQPGSVPLLPGNTFGANSTVQVLANRTVTTNTTWPVIANVSQYELVQDGGDGVDVEKSATLTLANGITITTDGNNYYSTEGLYVANDSSGAKIEADTVTFSTPLTLDSTASATLNDCQFKEGLYVGTPGGGGVSITGGTFSQTPTFDAPSNSALTISGNMFTQGVQIQPGSVPLLPGNTFGLAATVQVLGNRYVTTNVTWPTIPNVSQYELVQDGGDGIYVQKGATLTLAGGITVTTDGNNYYTTEGIYVANDSSGAKFVANGVTFSTPVFLESTAIATVIGCQMQQGLFVGTPGAGGVTIAASQFSETPTFDSPANSGLALTGNTFTQGVQIQPGTVPLLTGNTFGSDSTVQVLANRSITTNITWPLIPNVTQYELVQYGGDGVSVQKGATLTLSPGITITTDGNNYYSTEGLYVANDGSTAAINANTVTFNTPLNLAATAGGSIQLSQFDQLVTINGAATASIHNNAIGTPGVNAQGTHAQTIDLTNNWWGTTDSAVIASHINTDSTRPVVNYSPFLSADPTVTPLVVGVFADSTQWASTFPYASGYAIPTGASQLADLPWLNLNQVSVRFSEAVNVTRPALTVTGVNHASYATTGFTYNSATFTATWTFAAPLGTDKLRLDLAASGANAVIGTAAGVALDGTWTNGADAFPSGAAAPGTDFQYNFYVLPGDVAQNGAPVNILDVIKTRNLQLTSPGNVNYSPIYDLDGNGSVNILDVIDVRNRQLTSLPAGTP